MDFTETFNNDTTIKPQETVLRQKYVDLIKEYHMANEKIEKHQLILEAKFDKQIKTSKFWVIFNFIFIPVLPIIFLLIAYLTYNEENRYLLVETIFYIGCAVASLLITIAVAIIMKNRRKRMILKREIKPDEYMFRYEKIRDEALKNAANLVPELFIETQYGEKYLVYKEKAPKDEFLKTHEQLLKTVYKFIVLNNVHNSSLELTTFYENWYQENKK